MNLVFYRTPSGRAPVVDEIDSLPKKASAHCYELLEGVENHGFHAPRVIFRQIEGKLWEIKMQLPGTGGYRIFYTAFDGNNLVLLHAYAKRSQKAPKKELDTARNRFDDLMRRGM